MITITLAYAGVDEGFRLRFPSSSTENSETLLEVLYLNPRVEKIEIAEVSSNVYNLGGYLKNVDIWNPDNLEKLETLGRTLQTMERDSCLKFEGVLDANSVNGLDDVLRLSESLDEYILLPDAGGGSALGKYLVTHGMTSFPESVQPYLDYQIIGAEFYADHGGAFCRTGYVVRKEELPQQFLQTEQEQKSVMLLRLRTSHGKQQNPVSTTLALPAADELLEHTRQRLGIEDFAEAEITMVDYIFPYFATMVPQECITVESANALAQAIVQMNQTDGELLKYLAAVEQEQPDTFDSALQIARNIDNYEMIPTSQADDGFHTQFGQIRRMDAPIETQGMGGMELC